MTNVMNEKNELEIEKSVHKVTYLYDLKSIGFSKPTEKVPEIQLKDSYRKYVPIYEQRTSQIAWDICAMSYFSKNPKNTLEDFRTECVGTVSGLEAYRIALAEAIRKLNPHLTIEELKLFIQSNKLES